MMKRIIPVVMALVPLISFGEEGQSDAQKEANSATKEMQKDIAEGDTKETASTTKVVGGLGAAAYMLNETLKPLSEAKKEADASNTRAGGSDTDGNATSGEQSENRSGAQSGGKSENKSSAKSERKQVKIDRPDMFDRPGASTGGGSSGSSGPDAGIGGLRKWDNERIEKQSKN